MTGGQTKLEYNGCTIVIHRPQLTEAERRKREDEVRNTLALFMESYLKQKEATK